jgi:hypothetical protein
MIATSTILGIDPSAHGAIAVVNENGELVELVDMPSTPEANRRTATNAPLLAGILARLRARSGPSASSSEHVRPTRRLPRSPSGGPAASSKATPGHLACRSCS